MQVYSRMCKFPRATMRSSMVQTFAHFSTQFDIEVLIGSLAQQQHQTFLPAELEHSYLYSPTNV